MVAEFHAAISRADHFPLFVQSPSENDISLG